MASKNHRQGGKMGGRHTTIIDAAQKFVDLAHKMPEVRKIIAGYITPGIRGGNHRVKMIDMTGGVLLKIRGSASIQEIIIYSDDVKKTKRAFSHEIA